MPGRVPPTEQHAPFTHPQIAASLRTNALNSPLSASIAHAQVANILLVGTVTDPAGRVVPAA